jgi:hypothetical protein
MSVFAFGTCYENAAGVVALFGYAVGRACGARLACEC